MVVLILGRFGSGFSGSPTFLSRNTGVSLSLKFMKQSVDM
jgi:hypothetical protein